MLKLVKGLLFAALSVAVSATSFANTEDDADWISQCVSDNKKEGQAVETVMLYCHCMNEKMSGSETRSITEWEKTHETEEAACSKKAGWL